MRTKISLLSLILALGVLCAPIAAGDICNAHVRGSGCVGGGGGAKPSVLVTNAFDSNFDPIFLRGGPVATGKEVDDKRVFEGEFCTFKIKRTGKKKNIQVSYVTQDGTAIGTPAQNADYESVTNGFIDFREHTGKVVTVHIETFQNFDGNDGPEPATEHFFVKLQNPQGAKIADGSGKCVIHNEPSDK